MTRRRIERDEIAKERAAYLAALAARIDAEASADYWKRVALDDRLKENARRKSLGLPPMPIPKCLTE